MPQSLALAARMVVTLTLLVVLALNLFVLGLACRTNRSPESPPARAMCRGSMQCVLPGNANRDLAGQTLHSPGWRPRESSSARRLRVATTLPKQSSRCPLEALSVDGCVCRHAFELSRLSTVSALGRASIMVFG